MGCNSSKKQGDLPFRQTIVILRHSERLDHIDPEGYKASEEGKAWPFDTPLTAKGVQLAQEVARELGVLHASGASFAAVVASPYRRCMQTAAEVAKQLKLPVMIDQEVGEVWEKAMPSDRPPHRQPVDLETMSSQLGVTLKNPILPQGGVKLFGKPPQSWPETNEQGHRRCTVRVEYYIEQSALTKQNFIIVAAILFVHTVGRGIFAPGLLASNQIVREGSTPTRMGSRMLPQWLHWRISCNEAKSQSASSSIARGLSLSGL